MIYNAEKEIHQAERQTPKKRIGLVCHIVMEKLSMWPSLFDFRSFAFVNIVELLS